jgi:hypothetical protein
MQGAIKLNDQLLLRASEVNDIAGDRKLSPEARPISLCARSSFQSFNSAPVMTLRIDRALARFCGGKGV